MFYHVGTNGPDLKINSKIKLRMIFEIRSMDCLENSPDDSMATFGPGTRIFLLFNTFDRADISIKITGTGQFPVSHFNE